MKSFVKYVLATVTGLVITAGLIVLVIIGIVGSMSKGKEVHLDEASVLHLKLNYPLKDRTDGDPLQFLAALNSEMDKPVGLMDLMEQIDHASGDPKIKGIFLDLSFVDAGYAKLSELRDALITYRESGKFVVAYSDMFYNKTYYLASAADKIYLNPKGSFIFNGMAADVTFVSEAMKKLGIELQPIKRGKFKGAIEPFVLDSLSPANREQIESYLHSIYGNFVNSLAVQRGISADEVDRIADEMLVKNPAEALEHKLVDGLVYRDEVYAMINDLIGKDEDTKIAFVKPAQYANSWKAKGVPEGKIAVIYAEGGIVSGKGDKDEIGADAYAEALREIRLDDDIKAVVLRINSGGGSALASEIIWREADLLRQVKPLIVSMGDVAASGGYYIACMADTIFALPNTLTGSIGVFGLFPNFDKLLHNIGVHNEFVGTGKYSDFGRMDRALTEAEFAVIDTIVGDVYRSFLERVAAGRSMTVEEVDKIGQGRVWTGVMAKEAGLVDEFGGFYAAVKAAASRAGLDSWELVSYPHKTDMFTELMSIVDAEQAKQDFLKSELGHSYRYYELLKIASNLEGVQTLMPFTVTIQ